MFFLARKKKEKKKIERKRTTSIIRDRISPLSAWKKIRRCLRVSKWQKDFEAFRIASRRVYDLVEDILGTEDTAVTRDIVGPVKEWEKCVVRFYCI